MKTTFNKIIILVMLLGWGCSQHLERQELSYTPPVVKNQPRLIYPKIAQENYYTGDSKVILLVNKTGIVDKVYVARTSGYVELDNAAMDYCRSLVFTPATRNGEPVESRIEWEIKFNFTDRNMEARYYLRDFYNLLRKWSNSNPEERINIERKILQKHNEFVQNMKDGLNFNVIIAQVVSPALLDEWKKDWDAFPLSFLLYHDFITRFKDFDSIPLVKKQLYNALKFDIQYIKNTPSENNQVQYEKQNILRKIKNFISREYPDIILDELGLDKNFRSGDSFVSVCQNK
jgi:TonB family protein